MDKRTNRQWLLQRRPEGMVSADDFRFVEGQAGEPAEGELLVQNLYLSADPTQRAWMAGDTYLPAVKIGEVMRSMAVGRVIESKNAKFTEGQLVQGLFGWQDYVVAKPGGEANPGRMPPGVPIETAMSALGPTGITAYFGLLDIGQPQPGQTVVVSGAAGATGSAVGQIAKIKGCRAIGIAGGAQKCNMLIDELGFDAAIDYKADNVGAKLRELCPKGIDVFFDNVGGDLLDLALARLARKGRVVICGAIARYNSNELPPGPKNYMNLLIQRGRMEGFLVTDYLPRAAEAVTAIAGWMAEGKFKDKVDVQHGLENAPATLARLFKGENQGKQLLKITES